MSTIREFRYGDRVRVVSNKSKYYGQMATVVKEIITFTGTDVAIVPDNSSIYCLDGERSKYLRLRKTSVAFIGEGEVSIMAKLEGFKRVASIEQGSSYCKKDYYYALYDDDIKEGDSVLVTGTAQGTIYTVKEIFDVSDPSVYQNITAEIICKVDLSAYEKRVETRKKVVEIRKQMEKKKKEIESRKTDDYYASLDPEYASMLEELRELSR